ARLDLLAMTHTEAEEKTAGKALEQRSRCSHGRHRIARPDVPNPGAEDDLLGSRQDHCGVREDLTRPETLARPDGALAELPALVDELDGGDARQHFQRHREDPDPPDLDRHSSEANSRA